MSKDLHFKQDVLLDALKITIASISIYIEEGCTNKEKIIIYSNYCASIALKSFCMFNTKDKEYTKKEMALKDFKLIYTECFSNAYKDPNDLKDYFKFRDEYNSLSTDEKVIIMAILLLSSFYNNNSINKIKNILRTYIMKLKNTLKKSFKYYALFDMSIFDEFKIKVSLFKFLIENS